MKLRNLFCLVFLLFWVLPLRGEGQEKRNPFIVEWNDAVRHISPGEKFDLVFKFQVPAGHYLYQEKTSIQFSQLNGIKILKKTIPSASKHLDPFTHKEEEIYLKDFEIIFSLEVPKTIPLGRVTLEGELRYQGCSSDFCYRPMKLPVLIPLEISAQKKSEESSIQKSETAPGSLKLNSLAEKSWSKDLRKITSAQTNPLAWIEETRLEKLLQLNPFVLLALAFLAGILTAFTPCVLPIIPLTLAIIGLQKQKNFLKNLFLTFSLILGMALTYALLGLASAFLGLKVGFIFQSFYFLIFLILFFGIMSLALFDVIRLELPLFIRNFLGGGGGERIFRFFFGRHDFRFHCLTLCGAACRPPALMGSSESKCFMGRGGFTQLWLRHGASFFGGRHFLFKFGHSY